MGFKEPEAKVFLSAPITAKILEVERFTSAQDRFYATTQRSINKVTLSCSGTLTSTRDGFDPEAELRLEAASWLSAAPPWNYLQLCGGTVFSQRCGWCAGICQKPAGDDVPGGFWVWELPKEALRAFI